MKRSSKLEYDECTSGTGDTTNGNGNNTTNPPPPGSPHLMKQHPNMLVNAYKTQQEKEKAAKKLGYSRSNAASTSISTSKMSYSSNSPDRSGVNGGSGLNTSGGNSYSNNNGNTNNNITSYKLTFGTFVQTIATFQVDSHASYLYRFNSLFHRADDNGDGIVTLEQYLSCWSELQGNSSGNSSSTVHKSPSNNHTNSNNNNNGNSNSNVKQLQMDDTLLEEVLDCIDSNRSGLITYSNAVNSLHKIHYK